MRLLLLALQQVAHRGNPAVLECVCIFGGADLQRFTLAQVERAGEEDVDRDQHDRRANCRKRGMPEPEPEGERVAQAVSLKL